MKPNIHDVAKIAGVSSTTVSRVLNNRGYISEKTKEKVYKAMEEINYFPNDLALFIPKTNQFNRTYHSKLQQPVFRRTRLSY